MLPGPGNIGSYSPQEGLHLKVCCMVIKEDAQARKGSWGGVSRHMKRLSSQKQMRISELTQFLMFQPAKRRDVFYFFTNKGLEGF